MTMRETRGIRERHFSPSLALHVLARSWIGRGWDRVGAELGVGSKGAETGLVVTRVWCLFPLLGRERKREGETKSPAFGTRSAFLAQKEELCSLEIPTSSQGNNESSIGRKLGVLMSFQS